MLLAPSEQYISSFNEDYVGTRLVGFLQCQLTEATVSGQACGSTWIYYPDSEQTSICYYTVMLCAQKRSILTKPRLDHTIYRIRIEHANHYHVLQNKKQRTNRDVCDLCSRYLTLPSNPCLCYCLVTVVNVIFTKQFTQNLGQYLNPLSSMLHPYHLTLVNFHKTTEFPVYDTAFGAMFIRVKIIP